MDVATAAAALIPDAQHRVVACFHGLLSVLTAPLAQFVAQCRVDGPSLARPDNADNSNGKTRGAGVRMQLQFLHDHWDSHVRPLADVSLLQDVQLLIRVQNHVFYSATVSEKTVLRAIAAVGRLLDAVGADEHTKRQAHALTTLLGFSVETVVETPVPERRQELLDDFSQLLAGEGTAPDTSKDQPLRLLTEALALSTTTDERHAVLLRRSERFLYFGERAAAYEDAAAVLTAERLPKPDALRLAKVLTTLGRWNDAARAFDLGLRNDPDDPELQDGKKKILQNSESWEGSNDEVCWETLVTKSPLTRADDSPSDNDDDWLAPLEQEAVIAHEGDEQDQSAAAISHTLSRDDLERWGLTLYPPTYASLPVRQDAALSTESAEVDESDDETTREPEILCGGKVSTSLPSAAPPGTAGSWVLTIFAHTDGIKSKVIRKELVKRATQCSTSRDATTAQQAIGMLTEALDLAGSKKQRANILCVRGECYRKLGYHQLAYEDARTASLVPKLKSGVAARIEFLLAAGSDENDDFARQAEANVVAQRDETRAGAPDQESIEAENDPDCYPLAVLSSEHASQDDAGSHPLELAGDDLGTDGTDGFTGESGFMEQSTDDLEHPSAQQSSPLHGVETTLYAGCFHALLALLQAPLAAFVAKRRADGPCVGAEQEQKLKNLHKAGVKTQLQFVKDHWATHFSFATPASFLQDLKIINQVQSQSFYAAAFTRESYDRGIRAIERLLLAVNVDEDTTRRVQIIKNSMRLNAEANAGTHEKEEAIYQSDRVDCDGVEGEEEWGRSEGSVEESSDAVGMAQIDVHSPLPSDDQEQLRKDEGLSRTSQTTDLTAPTEPLSLSSTLQTVGQATSLPPMNGSGVEADNPKDNKTEDVSGISGTNGEESLLRTAKQRIANRDFGHAIYSINQELTRTQQIGDAKSRASLYVLLARCRFELKQYICVLKDAHDALALDRTNADGYGWACVALHRLGRVSEASAMCEEGLRWNPRHKPLLLHRNLFPGTPKTIVPHREVPEPMPTFQTCSIEAIKSYEIGDYEQAINWCSRGIDLFTSEDPSHNVASIFVRRGECFLALGDHVKALADADHALALRQAKYAKASALRVKTMVAMGLHAEALQVCVHASSVSPEAPDLIELHKILVANTERGHVETKSEVAEPQPEPWELELKELVKDGLAAVASSKFSVADDIFTRALSLLDRVEVASFTIAISPKKVKVLGHKARTALAARDFNASIEHARRGLAIDADWVEGHRLLCHAFMKLEKWSEARLACDAVVTRAPQDTNFCSLRQELASKSSQATSSKSSIQEIRTGDRSNGPNQAASWQSRVQGLMHAGLVSFDDQQFDLADARYTDALAVLNNPSIANQVGADKIRMKLLGHRARCRISNGNFQHAAVDAREGIASLPEWVEGYCLLCRALMGQGAWPEALEACDHVLRCVPADTTFITLKKQILEECEDEGQAAAANEADKTPSSSDTQSFKALSRKAIELMKAGKYAEAEIYCSKAIDLMTTQVPANFTAQEKAGAFINRARCHAEFGQFHLMLEDARAGLTHNPLWAEGYRLECIALMKLGRWHEAKQACSHVLAQVPTELMKDALARQKSKDFEVADVSLSHAILLFGESRGKKYAQCLAHRARGRLQLRTFDGALRDALEVVSCLPDWTEGYRLACRAYVGLRAWKDASDMCERVLAAVPQDVEFQNFQQSIAGELRLQLSPDDAVDDATRPKDPSYGNLEHVTEEPAVEGVEESPVNRLPIADEDSVVVQQYKAAQRLLSTAHECLQDGALQKTFEAVRSALALWPRLEIPDSILQDLMMIGRHDAVAWGGPMLFSFMQATTRRLASVAEEQEFWTTCVKRYPHDPDLHVTLADVLYRAGDATRSLVHVDRAIELRKATNAVPPHWSYFRARCLPSKDASPTHWLVSLFSKPREQVDTREDELLAFIQRACLDNEWLPHACYSLGVFYVTTEAFVCAKQLQYLAELAESRRTQLGFFAPINQEDFQDKRLLREAFSGSQMVLSLDAQQTAVAMEDHGSGRWRCALCGVVSTRVDAFAQHKLGACASRSALPVL